MCRILLQRQSTFVDRLLPLLFQLRPPSKKGTKFPKEVKSQSATEFAQTMESIWEETAAALRIAAEQMKRYYDEHRADSRSYKPGDLVLLEGSNLTTIRPSKKLDQKGFDPFWILSNMGHH